MDHQLVFDIGMHQGQDTGYYLSKGYRVVAVDADPRLIDRARDVFADAVRRGQLTLVHCAVADATGEVDFHLSEKSMWNSLNQSISTRENLSNSTVRVPARRLADIVLEHGVPVYCKIDVEGYDAVCLSTLIGAPEVPKFISAETECIGEHEHLTEAQALETLTRLHELGYRRFKLVDQLSLAVLPPLGAVYRTPSLWERLKKRLRGQHAYNYGVFSEETRGGLNRQHGYAFPSGASGPFGDDLAGAWIDFTTARETLLRHRREYYSMARAKSYGFWCDWHATV